MLFSPWYILEHAYGSTLGHNMRYPAFTNWFRFQTQRQFTLMSWSELVSGFCCNLVLRWTRFGVGVVHKSWRKIRNEPRSNSLCVWKNYCCSFLSMTFLSIVQGSNIFCHFIGLQQLSLRMGIFLFCCLFCLVCYSGFVFPFCHKKLNLLLLA